MRFSASANLKKCTKIPLCVPCGSVLKFGIYFLKCLHLVE